MFPTEIGTRQRFYIKGTTVGAKVKVRLLIGTHGVQCVWPVSEDWAKETETLTKKSR